MIKITEAQVEEALPITDAVTVVEQAFKDVADDLITIGHRGTLDMDNDSDTCIFLPALHKRHALYSMKYAASFPSCAAKGLPTVQSVIWLFSAETGEACAMIEGNHLTAVKTGAASAVATKHLANADAAELTIIGAGKQARTQLEGILNVRKIEKINLVDLDESQSQALKKWAEDILSPDIPIMIHMSAEKVLKQTDILVTCTTAKKPVLNGKDLKPGVHINGIGSFTPDMQELDEATILNTDAVIADSISEVWQCSGDLIVP